MRASARRNALRWSAWIVPRAAIVVVLTAVLPGHVPTGLAIAAEVALPAPAGGILFADLDGDGGQDPVVLFGDAAGCRLGRLVGSAAAPAVEPVEIGGGAALLAPVLSDVDADGTADLISVEDGAVLVRRGFGRGAFEAVPVRVAVDADLLLPSTGCSAGPMKAVDVTGDGRVELLIPILGGARAVPLLDARVWGAQRSETAENAIASQKVGVGSRRGAAPSAKRDAQARRSEQTPAGASTRSAAGPPSERDAPARGTKNAAENGFDSQGEANPTSAPGTPGNAPRPEPEPEDLIVEPQMLAGERALTFASPLPELLAWARAGEPGAFLRLGPVLIGSPSRLNFAWWERRRLDGAILARRSALALPPGEIAVQFYLLDLESDGRPEIVALTMPSRLKSFLGEYRLHVFRASDRADQAAAPFFSADTKLNYWQPPAITHRRVEGGSDLLLAFYRGLTRSKLTVELFRSDGGGSFDRRPRDFEVSEREEADRTALRWADVDGDGIEDLLTDVEGLMEVYRGQADRDRPVGPAPSWTAPAALQGRGMSVNISSEGTFRVWPGRRSKTFLHDLDGDGLVEILSLEESTVRIAPLALAPPKKPGKAR